MMVVASGFIEAKGREHVEDILRVAEGREMNITEVVSEKLLFIIKRETLEAVREELDLIRRIEHVRNVHLTYYSLE